MKPNSLEFSHFWLFCFIFSEVSIQMLVDECIKMKDSDKAIVSLLISPVKPSHVVTSIKQSPVLKGHLFLVPS
jgi:hypothetical protein